DHALYRLGMRDRSAIRIVQYLLLGLLGAWVARQVLPVGQVANLPRGAACSLVALFSLIFLYHRLYDAVILVVPLVYCVGRCRIETGAARALFLACVIAVLLVLTPSLKFLD